MKKTNCVIIWDVDGLMFNTEEIYYDLLFSELKKIGVSMDETFYALNGLDDSIHKLGLSEKAIQEVKNGINAFYYSDEILPQIKFKPGFKKVFMDLKKDYRFSIGSGEREDQINRYLNHFGLRDDFEFIAHGQMVEGRKSNPEYFKKILNFFNSDPEKAIFIGDSLTDTKAANAGIKTIIVPNEFTKKLTFPKNCLVLPSLEAAYKKIKNQEL